METSDITSQKETQNLTFSGKNDVDTSLGCIRASFGILPREGHSSKQCQLWCEMLRDHLKPAI
jgi:hypothetical protein